MPDSTMPVKNQSPVRGPRPLAGILRRRWRAWFRAVHRDVGYLLVGLTVIYAMSGIAINHIGQFDPNFTTVTTTRHVNAPIPPDDPAAAAENVLAALAIEGEVRDAYFEADEQLEIALDRRTLTVDVASGQVVDREEKPRFFLRVANWLHYNRGKAAWTYIADGYAALLLFLALSGATMLKGRKGLVGRGAILIALGALVPIAYVHFSGGPG
jgi:hypothetical protein